MNILGTLNDTISFMLFDIDNTVYNYVPEHLEQLKTAGEHFLSRRLGWSLELAREKLAIRRDKVRQQNGRPVTNTEVIESFGYTLAEWDEFRCEFWTPEKWIGSDPEIVQTIGELSKHFALAFGTNSPKAIGQRILNSIGLSALQLPFFGPGDFEPQKPQPAFYAKVVEVLGFQVGQCLSIGDREPFDCVPAIEAGYAAAITVKNRDELVKVLRQISRDGFESLVGST